jgi:hypothetical protein
MGCNNDCALCCCCGPGELVELPDYYCRFHSILPVEGFNYNCTDTTRQFLNWELTKQKADEATSTFFSLLADNYYAYLAATEFKQDEDVSCFISYGTFFNPYYQYGYVCFDGGSGEFETTGWKEIERLQYRCRDFSSLGNPFKCIRSQTWARISYDTSLPKIKITRCKVPNEACESEVSAEEDLSVGDCGYLVVATIDICYKIETQSYFSTGQPNAPCSDLPDFYDTPTGTITTVAQGTVCVTRSKVFKSLKNDPSDPDRIYFELTDSDSAIDCCKDWPSPFLRLTLPLGKPEDWNDENFRCSCETKTSFVIRGDECPDLSGLTCSDDYICERDGWFLQTPAGELWRFWWQ